MEEYDVIGPASPFQEKYLNADEQMLFVGGAAGCLPYETEVLTERGWIPIGEWKGQPIGIVELDLENKDHAVLRYESPKRYIKLPCESMRRLESPRFSMTLSDEHRVPYFYSEERLNRVLVDSFSNILDRHEASKNKGFSGRFHTALSGMVGGRGIPLNEWELRVQVAVMADGSFSEGGANNYCSVGVSKERKSKRLEYLCSMGGLSLRKLSTNYSDRYTNGKIDTYVVHPKLRQKRFEGVFWDATYEQLQIIVDEISHWDGSLVDGQKSGSTVRYYSKYKPDADFIQYAATVCGRTASIAEDKREGKETYTVNISRVKSRSFANKDGKCPIKTVKTSDGYKYCFETSTGFFLVRERGRIYVTGNSSKSYIGLMRHLRFVEDPNYKAYCIRKNSSAIMSSGGLFDEAVELYRKYDPKIKVKLRDQKVIFSSGAEITFSHYENDQAANKYQGKLYCLT